MHPVRPAGGRGQDVDLSTGHRRCRGSTCGYQAGIPVGILHPQQRSMPRGLLPTDGGSRYIGHRFALDRCLWRDCCTKDEMQSLSTFETNVREWHFVQHSLMRYLYWSLGEGKGRKLFSL